MMFDSPDANQESRRRMVEDQIRARGVFSERTLEAMIRVPREHFVPDSGQQQAFEDRALPIDCGQTISQPFMVAAMTEALRLRPHHRVLEIGTGSGYQTAILAVLARRVYTIERLALLQEQARQRLESLGITNVEYRVGDGSMGWPEESPFDRIIVTAAAPDTPPSLVAQLDGVGRLVIPVGSDAEQTLTIIDRIGAKTHEQPRFPCRFVKLIGREAWADSPDVQS
jgi:protein-L-isoaspartate(D-aspartate) O-methyltransferase